MIVPVLNTFYSRHADSPLMGGYGFSYRNGPTCFINIDSNGMLDPLRPYEFAEEDQASKEMMPFSGRTAVKAHPGSDQLAYLLGIGSSVKLQAFQKLTQDYVALHPNSIHSAILKFYAIPEQMNKLVTDILDENKKDTDSIVATFVINGQQAHKEPAMKTFWVDRYSSEVIYGKGFCSECEQINVNLVNKSGSIATKALGNGKEGKVFAVNDAVSSHSGSSVGFPSLCIDCAEHTVAALNYMVNDDSFKVVQNDGKVWYRSRYRVRLGSAGDLFMWDDYSNDAEPSGELEDIMSILEGHGKIEVDNLKSIQLAVGSSLIGGDEPHSFASKESRVYYTRTKGRQATVSFSSGIDSKKVAEVIAKLNDWRNSAAIVNSYGRIVVPGIKAFEGSTRRNEMNNKSPEDVKLRAELTMAALTGTKLPHNAAKRAMRRVFVDHKMLDERISLIKLHLIRNNGKEVSMSLDLDNKNPFYLAGRYYALACRAQSAASGGSADGLYDKVSMIDKNIPALLRLSESNFRVRIKQLYRTNGGLARILERTANECWDAFGLDSPASLSRPRDTDKMTMLLGYYHQNADLWRKKTPEALSINQEGTQP